MKIAVVHSFYSAGQPSGENTVVNAQVATLREAGHDVRLLSRDTDSLAVDPLFPMKAAWRAANLPGANPGSDLLAFEPDVVHVHNLFPNWSTPWLRRWSSRLVVTEHNLRPLCARGTFWRDGHDCMLCLESSSLWAVKLGCYRDSHIASIPLAIASRNRGRRQPVLKYPAVIITLNDDAKRIYSEVSKAQIVTIPNFVAKPAHDPKERAGWIYVGRLSDEKGILKLISGFPKTETLTIIGTGPLTAEVERECSRQSNLTLLGHLAHEDVIHFMQTARGFVLPSLWAEGIPTVAIEALACGTPILVSENCRSGNDLVNGGVSGLVYNPDDSDSLRNGIERIHHDWDNFSAAAEKHHRATYGPTRWLTAVQGVYDAVVAKNAT